MSPFEEREWQTRRDRIDTKLRSPLCGWEIIDFKDGLNTKTLTRHAVREYPTTTGPADYALFVKGQFLGIIEAKKVSVAAMNVLEQAKRYSKGATDGSGNWNGYRVPFLYSTNGENIYFIDVRQDQAQSRHLASFHSPGGLEELFDKDFSQLKIWFNKNPNTIDRIREYQKEAIAETEKAISEGHRKMLIAMATGTGKTFTTVAMIYRLLETKQIRRVLFLVDRKALAAQAVQAFHTFTTPHGNKFNREYPVYSKKFRREDLDDENNEAPFNSEDLSDSELTNPSSANTFVYVSTIQRMTMNVLGSQYGFQQSGSDAEAEEDADKLDIPIHAFDVIIADECHRGYTSKDTNTWRQVLEHFDAIKIGLTATPAQHTTQYFENLVYRYTVDQAVKDNYLVDYEAVKIKSHVKMNGVFLKPGEEVGEKDPKTGIEKIDVLEDQREFGATDIESKITVPETNRKIIEELAKYAEDFESQTGRFPKTLIFACNDIANRSHADILVETCRKVFKRGDEFVAKITGSPSVDRPLQKIKEFRNRPNPKIVVTVDMLSTGVDIPSLEFIVFLRPVQSRILWVQMLGRGTRLCKDINKTHFTIFDCFDGSLIEYFKDSTDFVVELPPESPKTNEQIIENIYQNIDRDYHVKLLTRRLRNIDKSMSAKGRQQFSVFIVDGDMGQFSKDLSQNLENHFAETMKTLKNKEFQELLYSYDKARNSFFVAYEAKDEVTSDVLFKVGDTNLKPEDYLDSFARFIKDKEEEIESVRILLKKPKEWKYQALLDLRNTLAREQYPEYKLQKAHKIVSHKDMADIISMVKHAAKEQEPVLTAEERVSRTLNGLIKKHSFNAEQQQWLELIRIHLVKSLSIEMCKRRSKTVTV